MPNRLNNNLDKLLINNGLKRIESLASTSDEELIRELTSRYNHGVVIMQSRKNNPAQGINAAHGDFRATIVPYEQMKHMFFRTVS